MLHGMVQHKISLDSSSASSLFLLLFTILVSHKLTNKSKRSSKNVTNLWTAKGQKVGKQGRDDGTPLYIFP